MKHKYTIKIKVEVSHGNMEGVLNALQRSVSKTLDNASFLTGKTEMLKSITIKES